MLRTVPILILSAAGGLLVGCRSSVATDDYRDWIEQDPPAWRVGDAGSEHRRDTLAVTPADAAAPDDLDGWVRLALQHNPGLRAAERKIVRLSERITQVSSFDDPMLQVVPFGQMAQTAAGEVGLMTGVSQKLPFPGKREARGEIAEQEALMAARELDARRLEVAADVRRAYWSLVYAVRAAEVVDRDRALIVQQRQIAEAKYRAGTAEQQDVLRAQVEIAGLENQLLSIEQRRRSAAAMLNRLADRRIDAAVDVAGDAQAEALDLELQLDTLLALAAEHPRLAVLREQIEQFRKRRGLANLDRYPDLTVSLNYNMVDRDGLSPVSNGDDQWWLGFGINIPIWQDRRDAAEREALVGILETSAMLAQEQNQLAFRIEDALARVQAQRASITLFEERILPESRQAVEAAESSYRAGRTDFIDLIDNTRRLTELDLMYQRSLTQLQQDLADLRLAVGQPVGEESIDHD